MGAGVGEDRFEEHNQSLAGPANISQKGTDANDTTAGYRDLSRRRARVRRRLPEPCRGASADRGAHRTGTEALRPGNARRRRVLEKRSEGGRRRGGALLPGPGAGATREEGRRAVPARPRRGEGELRAGGEILAVVRPRSLHPDELGERYLLAERLRRGGGGVPQGP